VRTLKHRGRHASPENPTHWASGCAFLF
jgi:hypothetical protein